MWDRNTLLHEWKEEKEKRLKPKNKVDYKADFVLKQERKKEKALQEKEDNRVPDSLITWIFQDDFIPRGKITKDGSYSIISDYLGTPVEAYDEEGNKVWERELDIYGRIKTRRKDTYGRTEKDIGEKNFIPFCFQGQNEDEEIGLYYNRFRYYDPQLGQYTQQDPIGLAGGNPTLYGYVNNSNRWVEPLGLHEILADSDLVFRGGTCLSNSFANGSSVIQNPLTGKVTEIFIRAKQGAELAELYSLYENVVVVSKNPLPQVILHRFLHITMNALNS